MNSRFAICRRLITTFFSLLVLFTIEAIAIPDIAVNRYATSEDAAHWNNVNVGDYLFFSGNSDGGDKIHSSSIALSVGGKILLYANDYERIFIDGKLCESTEDVPTVITNFGGQVRFGESLDNDGYRGFDLANFKHVYLSGKYDPAAQTGHPDFLGHDGGRALGSGDYYEKYGLWGDTRWSAERAGQTEGNLVRAYGYDSIKIDYVASWGGPFACFNLKQDNPSVPGLVKVDVQDTFCGMAESEGFYISYSTKAEGQDITQLTLRNNIVVLTGSEGLQTDNLAPGSVIENNIVVGTGRFYRRPFQAIYQVNAHQFSFVGSDVTIRDNIISGTTGFLIAPRYRFPGEGRVTASADLPILIENNYYGYGESDIGYVWNSDGVTPIKYINNVFGPISVPTTDDSKTDPPLIQSFINFGNDNVPITLRDNVYPAGAPFYRFSRGSGENLVENTGNQQRVAEAIEFVDLGFGDDFDMRDLAFYTPTYKKTPDGLKDGEAVPYKSDDIVMSYDETGQTSFFRCIQDHLGDASLAPFKAPDYWEQLFWNGRTLPPFDVRLKADTAYNYRGMGLTYNEENLLEPDFEAPVITIEKPKVTFTKGSEYFEFGVEALDTINGDLSSSVESYWESEPFDGETVGTYRRVYEVSDRAGYAALPVIREVVVADPTVTLRREIKVNLHRYSPANLADWTDVGNDTEGLRIEDRPTHTSLYDSNGDLTEAELLIEDIEGGYSEHYKNHKNTAGVAIGEFPPEVTNNGLRIRDPHENPCVLVFSSLPTDAFYDVLFTGYNDSGSGELNTVLGHDESNQEISIDIRFNSDAVGQLSNLSTSNEGRLDLDFSTNTPAGQPNLSGVILREKIGFGPQGSHPIFEGPSDLALAPGSVGPAFKLNLVDADSTAGELTVSWVSGNPSQISNDAISITGEGLERIVTIDTTGLLEESAEVTFLLSDGTAFYAQTVNLVFETSYQTWAREHFSFQVDDPELESSVWGSSANPDQDAHTNAFERLFRYDPLSADARDLPISVGQGAIGDRLVFSINEDVSNESWDVETSEDLASWQSATSDIVNTSTLDGLAHYVLPLIETSKNSTFLRFQLQN
ncbi:DUF5011 domain-containing protein [Puniceicoccaceae bacterium K14]|nr:DUF5011 domain-containing protein [Puniceicoccaceae bacterium K14]